MTLGSPDSLVELAMLYYREGMSQVELAKHFGVSRPTIASALKRCQSEGIVEIRINEPDSVTLSLEKTLSAAFGLDDAVVAKSGTDPVYNKQAIGLAAAELLPDMLHDGSKIGLSWGTSIYHTVQQLSIRSRVDVEVFQMLGALGSETPESDGFELARNLSRRLNGRYHVIQAPALVHSAELKRLLIREPSIRDGLERAARVDMALVGISSDSPQHSALVRAGFVSDHDAKAICEAGSIGHVCGYHLDVNGQFLDCDLNDRIIGIGPEALKAIPKVVAIASGAEKVPAILGTLRSGILNVLVTDENTALNLLREVDAATSDGVVDT